MNGGTVQVACFGGHGRTGTFLALVLVRLGVVKDQRAAIKLVQTNYCKNAIESSSQETAVGIFAKLLHHKDDDEAGGTTVPSTDDKRGGEGHDQRLVTSG